MKNKLIVCIDANIYISGFAFGGKPLRIIEHAFDEKFYLITSTAILEEVQRNLTKKLGLSESKVDDLLKNILAISTIYKPTGEIPFIPHKADTLVLETALLGNAHIPGYR